jgi:outer membrane lipoprotein SlyB
MKHTALLLAATLTACAPASQNRYGYQDVGQASVIEYGKIIAERPVDITGKNTGIGAAAGVTAGGIGGSLIGHGDGSIAGLLAGAIVGGIVGAVAEQALADRQGIEYTIREKAKTVTIVQNIAKDDKPLRVGDKVMVQISGQYQRVLPATSEPIR